MPRGKSRSKHNQCNALQKRHAAKNKGWWFEPSCLYIRRQQLHTYVRTNVHLKMLAPRASLYVLHFPVSSQPLAPHCGHHGDPLHFLGPSQPFGQLSAPHLVNFGVKVYAVTAWPTLPRPKLA